MSKTEIVKYPRLEIKNFGPITEAEIYVNDMMVFIGPQASGKSTIAKTIFLFKSIKEDLFELISGVIEEDNDITWLVGLNHELKSKIDSKLKGFIDVNTLKNNFNLKYFYEKNKVIEICLGSSEGEFSNFSKNIEELIEKIELETSIFRKEFEKSKKNYQTGLDLVSLRSRRQAFYQKMEKRINSLFTDDRLPLYIPAGRSLLSSLSEPLQRILLSRLLSKDGKNEINSPLIDNTLKAFIERVNNMKGSFDEFKNLQNSPYHSDDVVKNFHLAKKISDKILNGSYKFKK